MNNKPSLIDYKKLFKLSSVGLDDIKVVKNDKLQLGGFLSFLSSENIDILTNISIVIFFILLLIFLYYRYKNRKTDDFKKHQTIAQFISSVDNHLNYNITSI